MAGLVAVTVAANVVNGLVFPYRFELLGGRRETALAGSEAAGSLAQCVVALGAGVLHAYARPLGQLAMGVVRWVGFARSRRSLYVAARLTPTEGAPDPVTRHRALSRSIDG
jgi:hypothetical protein